VRVTAPSATAAAEYYPAQYWYSMLKIPDKSLFPGTGPKWQRACPVSLKSQGQWLSTLKTHACNSCHQLGNKPTRHHLAGARQVSRTRSRPGATVCRSAPAAETMVRDIGEIDTQAGAWRNFADWTDRIAAGELPKSKPQRPQGVERNVRRYHVGLGRCQNLPA